MPLPWGPTCHCGLSVHLECVLAQLGWGARLSDSDSMVSSSVQLLWVGASISKAWYMEGLLCGPFPGEQDGEPLAEHGKHCSIRESGWSQLFTKTQLKMPKALECCRRLKRRICHWYDLDLGRWTSHFLPVLVAKRQVMRVADGERYLLKVWLLQEKILEK